MSMIERYENDIEKSIRDIKSSQKPVVLFGAAAAGVLAHAVLKHMDINVLCYGDNSEKKQGLLFNGLPVFSAQDIKNQYPDAIVFVCAASKDIRMKLHSQLKNMEFSNVLEIDKLAHLFLKYKLFKKLPSEDAVEIMALISQVFYSKEQRDMLIINAIELSVTERCNLRCKDCANGMQYYKRPVHYEKETMINAFKRIADAADIVELVRIMGGEPFLHPELHSILDELSKIHNVNQIEIITNGTILPDSETIKIISKCNAIVYVSNYGELSVEKEEIRKVCEESNISCILDSKNNGWDDFGAFECKGRTLAENEIVFQECIANKNYNTLRSGKYYHCPRSAHGANLGVIPEDNSDSINILTSSMSTAELRTRLKEFICNVKNIAACDFCNSTGSANKLPRIPAAIQIKK
ncbi:MAG TPA: radical SAM protein [Patescibacteria group bacterium]|nr:radical SAM protein [Patescibacteria group bacterium]